MDFHGVCCPKLLRMLAFEREDVRQQGIMGLGSSAEGASALWALQPSLHRCGVRATPLLFVVCVTKRTLGNCAPLSCRLEGCIVYVLRRVSVHP